MPLHKGDLVGAYEIVAPLGQGGMATVYKAHHSRLNRYVAIKMIHQAYLQDENFVARFEREAQIVAALEHPHIVPIFDYSEQDGEPYIVMKFIEGSTLKTILTDGELPVDDILKILTPVASALDYAHSRGVLHRDIKPSNIMLDKQETPYLTDFGLARLTVSGASTLSQDLMIGTPYYMSPEQAVGKGEVDHRADIYSLGVVLYELFVGRVPFSEGTPYSIINDHVMRDLPMPRELNPDVPPLIELVLLRVLSKDPDDRYQNATELMDAMNSAVQTQGTQASVLSQGRQPAAESLVKHIAAASAAYEAEKTTTPTRAAQAADTRQPQKTAPMAAAAPASPQPRKHPHAVELGLLAILLVLILALVIYGLGKQNQTVASIPTLAAQQPTVQPTSPPPPQENVSLPKGQPPGSPISNPPPVPILAVPEMTVQQAQDAIKQTPGDTGAYLALMKDELQANQDAAARRTLADALVNHPDPIPIEMTAADTAVKIGRYDAAFAIYSQALEDAAGTRPYQAVRITAGEYLYTAATSAGQLSLAQVRRLSQELTNNTSPIVAAMVGRAFLASDLPRLAEAAITKALTEDSKSAEAHLVNGELKLANGSQDGARAEWQMALDSSDAPTWVRDKATELMNSLD